MSNEVAYWETPNGPNCVNRHATALGIEFFAFPHQDLYARKGHSCALIAKDAFSASYIAIIGNSADTGRVTWLDREFFPTKIKQSFGLRKAF